MAGAVRRVAALVSGLRDLDLGRGRIVPARLLSVRFTRGGGPGGQNVNKVATRAELRLDLGPTAGVLGARGLARVKARLARRLDAEGRLRVVASASRHAARNLEAAHQRMEELLREAATAPRERRATRPTRASRERRLHAKRNRGQTKRLRREPDD